MNQGNFAQALDDFAVSSRLRVVWVRYTRLGSVPELVHLGVTRCHLGSCRGWSPHRDLVPDQNNRSIAGIL